MKKVLEFLGLVMLGLVLGVGIVYVKAEFFDKPAVEVEAPAQQGADTVDAGYTLALVADVSDQFVVDVAGQQEFRAPVKVHNFSGHDATFTLLVYLDYRQLSTATQQFTVKNGEELLLPVAFSLQDLQASAHDLVLSLIADSNQLTSERKEATDFFGTSARYTLVTKSGVDFPAVATPAPSESTWDAKGFRGVFMDQSVQDFETFHVPPKQIVAKRGEMLEFTIRAGGDPEVEQYLVWSTIGWNQVRWEDGEPYWYAQVPRGQFAVRKLRVRAPEQAGDYEVASFITEAPFQIPDPTQVTRLNVNTSFRFTLHVE